MFGGREVVFGAGLRPGREECRAIPGVSLRALHRQFSTSALSPSPCPSDCLADETSIRLSSVSVLVQGCQVRSCRQVLLQKAYIRSSHAVMNYALSVFRCSLVSWKLCASTVQRLYGKIPRVRVPEIKWGGLTTRRVLTMEWIDGVKLTDAAAMAAAGLRIVDFVDVGIECSLRQLLAEDGGFFHADPHPGRHIQFFQKLSHCDIEQDSSAQDDIPLTCAVCRRQPSCNPKWRPRIP